MQNEGRTLHLISRVHELGNNFILKRLKAAGFKELSPSHGDILFVLYGSDKQTMKSIADKIRRTKATVSVLIDKLEKMGFVRREKSSDDARNTYILLTEKGNEFKEVFKEISKGLNKMICENLSKDDIKTLNSLLEKMLNGIQ